MNYQAGHNRPITQTISPLHMWRGGRIVQHKGSPPKKPPWWWMNVGQKQVFGWMLCEVLRGRTRTFNFGRTFCALTRQKQNLCEVCGTQTSGIKVTQHFRKGTSEVRIRGFPATAGCLGFSWIADGSMGWLKLDSDSASALGACCFQLPTVRNCDVA